MTTLRAVVLLASCLVSSGCMTTVTQIMYFTDDKNLEGVPMVYSGTQGNAILIKSAVTEGPFESVGHSPFVGFIGFLDFFPSLFMDTAILPLTIGEEIERAITGPDQPENGDFEGAE